MRSLSQTIPLLLSMTAACAGSAPDGDLAGGSTTTTGEGLGPPAEPPIGTSVFLEVVTPLGEPVSRAAVTLYVVDPGDPDSNTPPSTEVAQRVTDAAGHLLVEALVAGRFVAKVEAEGRMPASVALDLAEGAHAGARVVLHPLAAAIVFQAEQGASLAHEDVRVEIPAGALVDADGAAVTGLVEATLTPFDPSNGMVGLPWSLAGVRSAANGGELGGLKSVYMADIGVWQGGRRLALAAGQTARVEFVLPEVYDGRPTDEVFAIGDEIPGWAYDYAEGVWREERPGTVGPASNAPGRLAWTVEVDNFDPRNCDEHFPPRCILVSVFDEQGDPIANQAVGAEGPNTHAVGQTGPNGEPACLMAETTYTVNIYAGVLPNTLADVDLEVVGPPDKQCGGGNCLKVGLELDGKGPVCTPGEHVACPYSGDDDQVGVGICAAGTDFCGMDGQWLGCEGEQLPAEEKCNTDMIDEDCDSVADEPTGMCMCVAPDAAPCFPFDDVVIQGACQAGTQECANGEWGACVGAVGPHKENCATLDIDENCDGNPGCGDAQWTSSGLGDAAAQRVVDVAVDAMGSVYVAGYYSGSIEFDGNTTMVGEAAPRAFVAKYANDAFQWARDLGVGWTHELDLATRGVDVYLAGTHIGPAVIDGCGAIDGASADVVVVQLDNTNVCVTHRQIAADDAQSATGIVVAGDALYVTGLYRGAPSFGGAALADPVGDSQQVFVARLKSAGLAHVWSASLPAGLASDDVRGSAVALSGGGLFVAGSFSGAQVYGNDPLVAEGSSDLFLTRMDGATGAMQWIERFGNAGDEPGQVSLAGAAGGDVVLTGMIRGEVSFGVDAPAVGIFEQDTVFVARLDAAGAHRWSSSHVLRLPAGADGGQAVAVDSADRVVLVGTMPNAGGELFLRKVSGKGELQWERTLGGAGEQVGAAIAVGAMDRLFVVGSFEQDFSVDNTAVKLVEGGDAGDGYILRLNP